MDPSALIFVALAVAWAVYLIPKALEHHEASDRSRTIDRFSHSLRVLGRREPVSPREARLVTSHASSAAAAPVAMPARRAAAVRATKRRRTVLTAILVVLVATGALAGFGMLAVHWVAVPVVVLAAWLVACRLMVKKERAVPVRRTVAPASAAATAVAEPVEEPAASEPVVAEDPTAEVPVVTAEDSGVGRWDPVQVPLPTYVSKPPAARRTVRTIDLDGTGVWSSGRNDADSALAREADAARGTENTEPAKRQTGS